MNYLDAVNRILRVEGVIAGDDDNATSFSDTAHENMINLAKIAIEDELSDYVSDSVIPYEEANGYITLSQSVATYTLNTDYIRMRDVRPFLQRVDVATSTGPATDSNRLLPYQGGEEKLRADIYNYRTTEGTPIYFYFSNNTVNQIGVYPVPDSSGRIYRYDYQKNVAVSTETDTIPFINTITQQAFVAAASIRFRVLRINPVERKQLYPGGVENDQEHQAAKARLSELVRRTAPPGAYGRRYT